MKTKQSRSTPAARQTELQMDAKNCSRIFKVSPVDVWTLHIARQDGVVLPSYTASLRRCEAAGLGTWKLPTDLGRKAIYEVCR